MTYIDVIGDDALMKLVDILIDIDKVYQSYTWWYASILLAKMGYEIGS